MCPLRHPAHQAKVRVTSYGLFEPANVSISLGTTVTWVLETYESVRLLSAPAQSLIMRPHAPARARPPSAVIHRA